MGVGLYCCHNPGVTSNANISGAAAGTMLNIFPEIELQRLTNSEGASDIRTIEISIVHLVTPLT
jgi:hypothetical protein